MTTKDTKNQDPIIICGAGPGGLLAALVLEKHANIPYTLIERASPSKICSNAGSGFDLGPTAISIMINKLGLNIKDKFPRYAGVTIGMLEGSDGDDTTFIRKESLNDDDAQTYSASRSTMQHHFLETLLGTDKWTKIKNQGISDCKKHTEYVTQSGVGKLRCGAGVSGYKETDENVVVELTDGSEIVGSVLLGFDGIHSAVRKQMMSEYIAENGSESKGEKGTDEYNFCNINCFWGKTELQKGSKLKELVEVTQQTVDDKSNTQPSFLILVGSKEVPGTFFMVPTEKEDIFNWILCTQADNPPKKSSDDLTRRGGFVLNDKDKAELQQSVQNYSRLMQLMIEETPCHAMTNVGLFDRESLDLPYSTNKRVAVLGDAAHPQSPFMGQGCNMALTDAYVLATRLCHQSSVSEALTAYNSPDRRSSVNKVILDARWFGNLSVSNHWFTCWAFKFVFKYTPMSWIVKDVTEGADQSNADFVAKMHSDLGLE